MWIMLPYEDLFKISMSKFIYIKQYNLYNLYNMYTVQYV